MQAPSQEDQNSQSIDLVKYMALLWHWAWLIVLAAIIAAVCAYFISKLISPVYQAKTTILVDMAPSNKSLDYNTLLMSSQLTQTYSQMLIKAPVLDEVAKRLGISAVDAKNISAKPITNTQLINIFAESTDPEQAADIVNMLVAVFADQIRSLQEMRFSASEESLQAQMMDIETKIKEANDQLAETQLQSEKDRLETMIANYSQTYAGLLQSYEQVRLTKAQTLSSIVQIEPAETPIEPVRPRTLINVAIAGLVSAFLAIGLIIVFDLLNDTVRTPEQIVDKLGLPVLGVIAHYRDTDGIPITESQPMSPITEAFRTLRTNVKYAGASLDIPLRSIMVTSALPGEGKTDVLVNLGVMLAQNKLRVLLMDADLRRPTLHRRLGLDNLIGLSQIFVHPELGISYSLQPTRITGLTAITAGDSPPNPSELLGSQLMGNIIEQLKSNYDILLIDTPPALAVTDAAVILPYIEGMLLVVKPGSTSIAPLRRMVSQFQQLNANMLGVVLNDINLRSSSYGYYYKQYKYQNSYERSDDLQNVGMIKQSQSKLPRKNGSYSSNQMLQLETIKNPIRKMFQSIRMKFRNV